MTGKAAQSPCGGRPSTNVALLHAGRLTSHSHLGGNSGARCSTRQSKGVCNMDI